jgi:hypothetical protein
LFEALTATLYAVSGVRPSTVIGLVELTTVLLTPLRTTLIDCTVAPLLGPVKEIQSPVADGRIEEIVSASGTRSCGVCAPPPEDGVVGVGSGVAGTGVGVGSAVGVGSGVAGSGVGVGSAVGVAEGVAGADGSLAQAAGPMRFGTTNAATSDDTTKPTRATRFRRDDMRER